MRNMQILIVKTIYLRFVDHCIEYFLEIGSINTSEILFILDTIYSTYYYQCIGEICQLVISLSCMDNNNLCIGLVIMM